MKMLTIQKINNISDKQLSFIFLINLVNYKKFKSIKKRLLLPNYYFYRYFIKILNKNYLHTLNRVKIQPNSNVVISFPGSFIHKRMFLKHTNLLKSLSEVGSDYYWYSGFFLKNIKKNKYFKKINMLPLRKGNNIILPKTSAINDIYNIELPLKYKIINDADISFNLYIPYNLVLLSMAEIYKLIILLYLYNINKIN